MSTTRFYDRAGQPMSLTAWEAVFGDRTQATVARSEIGDTTVSTVWLGIDYRFHGEEGPPIIFESMVFGGPLDQEQERYCTEAEALAGHAALVARVNEIEVGG